MRGHPEPAVLGRRRGGEHLVAVERRPHLVGAQHVLERQRVRGGRDVVERQRLDVGGVTEDARELRGQVLDLGVGERETRELRDVLDIGT